jgi:hypothetical protein
MGHMEKTPVLTIIGVIVFYCRVGAGTGGYILLIRTVRGLPFMSLFRQMCILRKPLIVRDKKE